MGSAVYAKMRGGDGDGTCVPVCCVRTYERALSSGYVCEWIAARLNNFDNLFVFRRTNVHTQTAIKKEKKKQNKYLIKKI